MIFQISYNWWWNIYLRILVGFTLCWTPSTTLRFGRQHTSKLQFNTLHDYISFTMIMWWWPLLPLSVTPTRWRTCLPTSSRWTPWYRKWRRNLKSCKNPNNIFTLPPKNKTAGKVATFFPFFIVYTTCCCVPVSVVVRSGQRYLDLILNSILFIHFVPAYFLLHFFVKEYIMSI